MKNLSFLILFTLMISGVSFGQNPGFGEFDVPPPGDENFEDDTDDEIIPIDGLIALGLLAGAVYGIRKKR
ncbi:MAG: hypothetical protein LAT51_04000 [Flavobacteriaceae bacterium]|nr:hypothetical protein [Flavobacteriaceae bacterium]